MLRLAATDSNIFEIDDYEIKAASGKQYSYFTMEYFREKYPGDELFFLMGADLLAELPKIQGDGSTVSKEVIQKDTKEPSLCIFKRTVPLYLSYLIL